MTAGRILLVPAPCIASGKVLPYVAYGLFSLQAVAKACDREVDVLDYWAICGDTEFRSSDELVQTVTASLDGGKYRAVGFGTMCSSFHHSLGMALAAKRRHPEVKVWLGGPHASVAPGTILEQFPEIDAVFVGEGESTFAEVMAKPGDDLDAAIDGVEGVWSRRSTFTARRPIKNLDQLPFVDDAADFGPTVCSPHTRLSRGVPLEAERGCPGRCTFCSTRLFWQGPFRQKSDERLITEMRRLEARIGKKEFDLIGDNLASSAGRLRSFCHTIRQQAPDYRWSCSLKLENLESSDLDLMRASGCTGIFVGVESGSTETLERIRKGIDLDHTLRLVHEAIEKGFAVDVSFIAGFPWETIEDIRKTYQMHADLLRAGVSHSQITSPCPLPGTVLEQSYSDSIQPLEGESSAAIDDLPFGAEAGALVERCPQLFRQLGRFDTPNADAVEVKAIIQAGAMLSSHYEEMTKQPPSDAPVDSTPVS